MWIIINRFVRNQNRWAMEAKKQKIYEYIMDQIKSIDYFEGDEDKDEYAREWAEELAKLE